MEPLGLDDTIAAISTPLGEGGLAIVRVSGREAFQVADRCFVPAGKHARKPSAAPTHTIHYGHIQKGGKRADEVLLSVLRAPRTFTREHMVEVSCHGGLLPARLVLEAFLDQGARLAHPGEFTRRAFLNGRIDLTQAEAVIDLIHSKTTLALAAAHEQLAGKLSLRINQLRDDLMRILAHVEAHIDFPDEDIAPDTADQLKTNLRQAIEFMDQLLRTSAEGKILRRGVRAAIIGRPNAGKSSLLNQLLGHDRAIVSPVPGTTRDTIEETANIRGIPIIFIDTAGLRKSGDQIEQEGMRRSRVAFERAELILHVIDRSLPLDPEDEFYLKNLSGGRRIVVCNKNDLPGMLQFAGTPPAPVVELSCATGEGLEPLKERMKEMIWSGEIQAEMLEVMINSRHQEALQRSRQSAAAALQSLEENQSLELVALDLRMAAQAAGEIVGQTSTEDLLDAIFSQFCLGK